MRHGEEATAHINTHICHDSIYYRIYTVLFECERRRQIARKTALSHEQKEEYEQNLQRLSASEPRTKMETLERENNRIDRRSDAFG